MLLHIGDDSKVKQLFSATVHSLMMGLCNQKHVGVDVLWHYCNSNELYMSVGLNCNN